MGVTETYNTSFENFILTNRLDIRKSTFALFLISFFFECGYHFHLQSKYGESLDKKFWFWSPIKACLLHYPGVLSPQPEVFSLGVIPDFGVRPGGPI